MEKEEIITNIDNSYTRPKCCKPAATGKVSFGKRGKLSERNAGKLSPEYTPKEHWTACRRVITWHCFLTPALGGLEAAWPITTAKLP